MDNYLGRLNAFKTLIDSGTMEPTQFRAELLRLVRMNGKPVIDTVTEWDLDHTLNWGTIPSDMIQSVWEQVQAEWQREYGRSHFVRVQHDRVVNEQQAVERQLNANQFSSGNYQEVIMALSYVFD